MLEHIGTVKVKKMVRKCCFIKILICSLAQAKEDLLSEKVEPLQFSCVHNKATELVRVNNAALCLRYVVQLEVPVASLSTSPTNKRLSVSVKIDQLCSLLQNGSFCSLF